MISFGDHADSIDCYDGHAGRWSQGAAAITAGNNSN